jgi:hypothetical protein
MEGERLKMRASDPVIDKMADKYALLTQFYCQVKGAAEHFKGQRGEFPMLAGGRFIDGILDYLSEYESAVAKLEVKSDKNAAVPYEARAGQ